MIVESLLLFFVGGLNIIMAILVLARNSSKLQNRLFFLFSMSLAGWVIGIGGFLLSSDSETAFKWAKAYYFFPLVVAVTMPLFSRSFPYNDNVPKGMWIPILAGFILVAGPLLFARSFVTDELVYHDWGKEIALNPLDYAIYSVYLVGALSWGLVHIFLKSGHALGIARSQMLFYFYGFFFTSIFGVFFNLILPWFGNYRLIWIGPLFTGALVSAVAFGMVRHRMFDVRLAVVRSITYLVSLVAIAVLYGFIVFGAAQYIFGLEFSWGVQAALSMATGVAVLFFQPVKNFFDRITKRLFYRDAYDPQHFFDEFNSALVSTINLDKLLDTAAKTITSNLKAQYCLIAVKDDKNWHVVGSAKKQLSPEEISQVEKSMSRESQTVIITDDLFKQHERLYHSLSDREIAAWVNLKTNYQDGEAVLGHLILGSKRSGSPYTNLDIKVLEAATNELVIAIQNALRFQEIENFNITLQHKVEEATKQLRQKNERLRVLDQTKDDFISMSSHQLRTPLTSVKGYVSMVLEEDAGKINDLQRKLLNQSFVSAQRMVYLISDLLNVSRLRTGKFEIEPIPTNLATVIQGEVEQLQETAQARKLELSYTKPEHFPVYMLDETKLRQVIMNFIDNAIYYTPSGGKIEVALTDKPSAVEFTVTDTGIGVANRDKPHMFTKYFRAHNAKVARPDGTGLGLFMAKKVIIAHGGAIIFKSREHKGSTFGFSLPKKALQTPPDKAKKGSAEDPQKIDKKKKS